MERETGVQLTGEERQRRGEASAGCCCAWLEVLVSCEQSNTLLLRTWSKWYSRPDADTDILSHRKSPLQVRSASSVKVLCWRGTIKAGGGAGQAGTACLSRSGLCSVSRAHLQEGVK